MLAPVWSRAPRPCPSGPPPVSSTWCDASVGDVELTQGLDGCFCPFQSGRVWPLSSDGGVRPLFHALFLLLFLSLCLLLLRLVVWFCSPTSHRNSPALFTTPCHDCHDCHDCPTLSACFAQQAADTPSSGSQQSRAIQSDTVLFDPSGCGPGPSAPERPVGLLRPRESSLETESTSFKTTSVCLGNTCSPPNVAAMARPSRFGHLIHLVRRRSLVIHTHLRESFDAGGISSQPHPGSQSGILQKTACVAVSFVPNRGCQYCHSSVGFPDRRIQPGNQDNGKLLLDAGSR